MTRYDTSQTSPDFEPPPRRLGSGIWLGAVIVIALVVLGVFVWGNVGGQSSSGAAQQTPATTTGSAPAHR
jgi:ABC-type transporter Mla subunit MlaD